MSIPVACQCGQRFMAQPHLAGQYVKCPVCGLGIHVPTAAAPGPQAYAAPAYLPPQAQYAPAPQTAPGYGRPAPPPEPKRSGPGPLLYVGIAGAVLLFLIIGAVAALMIGYDLARTALAPAKKSAGSGATSGTITSPAKSSDSSVAPAQPQADARPSAPNVPAQTRLSGPVVVFQMLDYRGSSHSGAAAQKALTPVPWFSGRVVVDHAAGEIVVGVRSQSLDTSEAKQALENAGFRIGSTAYKPGGR